MKKVLVGPVTIVLLFVAATLANPPEPQWTTRCKIVEIYDGDTITIEVTRRIRVRMLRCWAPEVRTSDKEEKARGIKSRDHLRGLAQGKEGVLSIPTSGADRFDHLFTFGRVLGYIWVDGNDTRSLSEIMVEDGYATEEKQ